MDPRWRTGAFLGRAWNSDQNFILLPNGDVTRARAMVRVVQSKRWQIDRLQNVITTQDMDTHSKTDAIETDPAPHRGLEPAKGHDVEKLGWCSFILLEHVLQFLDAALF